MGAQMKGVQLFNTIAWEQFYKEIPKQPFLLITLGDKESLQFSEVFQHNDLVGLNWKKRYFGFSQS